MNMNGIFDQLKRENLLDSFCLETSMEPTFRQES